MPRIIPNQNVSNAEKLAVASSGLSPKQLQGISALLSGESIVAAAKISSVDARTLSRWLNHNEKFMAEYSARCSSLSEHSFGLLCGLRSDAIKALSEIVRDTKQSAMSRIKAAGLILTESSRAELGKLEMRSLEKRLNILENAV